MIKTFRFNCFVIIFILIGSTVLPVVLGENFDSIKGFDKGPSYKSVIPIKRVTFVNFDENSILDDYAYLAAVPTAVFSEGNNLFSNPLLFYQDEYPIKNDKELSLNVRQGIDYFMEDWMSYCNDWLDKLTLINVPKNKLDQNWKAKEYNVIDGDDPYTIANEIALQEWSYSDNAVVAVIEEQFEKPDEKVTTNTLKGTLPSSKIRKEPTHKLKQTNQLNPIYYDFNVPEGYKYITAEAWWDSLFNPDMYITIPGGDPDLQLYFKQDNGWIQSVAASEWNLMPGFQGSERANTRVYTPGLWRIGITDIPTKVDTALSETRSGPLGIFQIRGSLIKALLPGVTYYLDITMYPGVDIEIPDPPFGCRNADFSLKWHNSNVKLGFSLIGPSGEVIYTEINESRTDSQEMHINQLGECLEGESYYISVFALGDVSSSVNFELECSWQQNILKDESYALASATEGAVLASTLNAPLLYISSSELSQETIDVIYKLGIENIYIVDLEGNLSKNIRDEINDIAMIKENYRESKQIYDAIREITGSNDVIFSTVDPWSYWYVAYRVRDRKPAGETKAGLFIGPAAYIAAQHGAPVIIIDNHPELSSAIVYHTEFWIRYASKTDNVKPSVAEMYFTGRRTYDFLRNYGFDEIGRETMITVADQFDIGMPWDRTFVGAANPGRFCGSPVDTAYWISRNVFYPALIFVNPALQGEVTLINGSTSTRQGLRGLLKNPILNTLVITRKSGKEEYEFPVLCSFVGYEHRFNERASKYYKMVYQTADGNIPGESISMEFIDQGTIEKFTGKEGSYFPDMSISEVLPIYLERGGYDVAYSTSLEAITNNLNQGVILWKHDSHGNPGEGGRTELWEPEAQLNGLRNRILGTVKDDNPWRGYEWYLGSTEEPDTLSLDIKGFIPFTNIHLPGLPSLTFTWVLARKPIREMLNKIIPFIDPFRVDNLYDGVIASMGASMKQNHWKNVSQIEPLLENLHSVGFITSMCQTSNTYFHMMLIRHGSVFQVEDPWPTSWYSTVWGQSIPRDIILGDTLGDAYTKGMSHVGILYLEGGNDGGPQWWWDLAENVVYFGDPDLRMYVPTNDYSDVNQWDKKDTRPLTYDTEVSINGHMPFGVASYPNEKKPVTFWEQYLLIIVIIVLVIILLIAAIILTRKKK